MIPFSYQVNQSIKTKDAARHVLFGSAACAEALPTTSHAAHLHIMRSYWQRAVWKNVDYPDPLLPSITE